LVYVDGLGGWDGVAFGWLFVLFVCVVGIVLDQFGVQVFGLDDCVDGEFGG